MPSRRCLPHRTKEWYGNISLTIHPTTIFSHSNTQRTSEDWCRILLECCISSHIWQAQIILMWRNNTEVLQHRETNDNPSQCIWLGTKSHTHSGWWSSHLHIHPKHSHPLSSAMQTMEGNYSPVSLVQNISKQMFLVDISWLRVITNY